MKLTSRVSAFLWVKNHFPLSKNATFKEIIFGYDVTRAHLDIRLYGCRRKDKTVQQPIQL